MPPNRPPLLLGLDLGTGSCKALLLEPTTGQVLTEASAKYAVSAPQLGWSESNPNDWWQAIVAVTRQVVQNHDIAAIGLSGQMHGLVLCDQRFAPLRPAMLWSDTRSQKQLGAYQNLGPATLQALGNPLVAGQLGPSWLWCQTHEAQILQRAQWALLPKDWLRAQMCGTAHSDPSDASATLLYDLAKDDWAWETLEALGLDAALLPPLLPSGVVAGWLSQEAANALGLPVGTPIATGGGDTPCAMLGAGLLHEHQAQLSVGTGAQIVVPVANTSLEANAQRGTHLYRTTTQDAPRHYRMAAMQNAGLALERVRAWLGLDWPAFYQAAFANPHAHGLIFLPYLTGERSPHLNPQAKGAFLGLGLHHTQHDLARAAFEGVAFAIADGHAALGITTQTLRVVGGGTLEPRWRQLLADALGQGLYASNISNASARGAAVLAGLAVGVFETPTGGTRGLQTPQLVAEPQPNAALEDALARFRAAYPKSQ